LVDDLGVEYCYRRRRHHHRPVIPPVSCYS